MTSRGTTTLSVRIDLDMLEKLKQYTSEQSVTQVQVIERLLEYFFKQNSEVQHVIISRSSTDEIDRIDRITRAMQLIQYGDHAYRRKAWAWAIETYDMVYRLAADEPDLIKLLAFKLGGTWIYLATELRNEALRCPADHLEDRLDLYNASIQSLRVAAAYFVLFDQTLKKKTEPVHPTALYNQACSLSLIAQYITERNATEEETAALRDAQAKATTCAAKSSPPGRFPLKNAAHDAVPFLDAAMHKLDRIEAHYPAKTTQSMPLSSTPWLFELATTDPDLDMLRNLGKDNFDSWLMKRKRKIPILYSYTSLKESLPTGIVHIMREQILEY